jgi:hypothetical protein
MQGLINAKLLFQELRATLRYTVSERDALKIASQAFLVSLKLRPAALITGLENEEDVEQIRNICRKKYSNIIFIPLPESKSAHIFLRQSSTSVHQYERLKQLKERTDLSEYHQHLGTMLGYLTPLPLDTKSYPEGTLTAEIRVEDSEEGFQIAPQIVAGISEDAIRAHFEPIVNALNELYTAENIPHTVRIKIESHTNFIKRSQGKTRKFRKVRKSRKSKRKTFYH